MRASSVIPPGLLAAMVLVAAGCARDPQPADVLAGDWQLVSIASPSYNADVGPTPTPPIVHFRVSTDIEGTVGGTDGCNEWTGEYSVPADGHLQIGPLARTLRQCIRVYTLAEGGYAGVELGDVTRYQRTETALVLSSDDGKTRLTLRR